MLMSLRELLDKHKLTVRGVIHIGAHYGQEYEEYVHCGVKQCIFFEPLPGVYDVLKARLGDKPNVTLVNKAVGPENSPVSMYVESANQGMSSSILRPKHHLDHYPHIVFNDRAEVQQTRLDDWMLENSIQLQDFNMINIDVQGYELQALQSGPKTLGYMDAVYAEINSNELYEAGTLVETLDAYLAGFGFSRVESSWCEHRWGDGLYVK